LFRMDEVEEPAGEFPNVNDRADIKKVIKGITNGAYGILAALAVLGAGLIYGLVSILS
jgi:hypothetical protein